MLSDTYRRLVPDEPLTAKVPEITALFWVVKILTTGMGEAFSDWLGNTNIILAGVVGVGVFAGAMLVQLRSRRYHAVTYWFAVMMVAVFGTMAADGVHGGLMLPYAGSTAFYAVVVGLLFWRWHKAEGTLDIHSITTRSRELYYWATVLATFALGTAAGDLTAAQLGFGFFPSALVFAGIIAVPLVAWWRFNLNSVVAFWAAYVVTRPLGASFADWGGKPKAITGEGWGDGTVSAVLTVMIVALVAWLAWRRNDIQEHREAIA